MDPVTYLTTPATSVGALEWVFFAAQIAVAIAGVYIAFMLQSAHPIRARALRQLGYALIAVGIVGAVVGALRISGVAPFTMPIWITIATLFNVVLAGFAVYYATSVLPTAIAAHDQTNRARPSRPGGRPHVAAVDASRAAGAPGASNGVARPSAPPSGRRDARRDRKRKSR